MFTVDGLPVVSPFSVSWMWLTVVLLRVGGPWSKWTLSSLEMVFSVIYPYGCSSYLHTNDVCLEKENLFPCKGIPRCSNHLLLRFKTWGSPASTVENILHLEKSMSLLPRVTLKAMIRG